MMWNDAFCSESLNFEIRGADYPPYPQTRTVTGVRKALAKEWPLSPRLLPSLNKYVISIHYVSGLQQERVRGLGKGGGDIETMMLVSVHCCLLGQWKHKWILLRQGDENYTKMYSRSPLPWGGGIMEVVCALLVSGKEIAR